MPPRFGTSLIQLFLLTSRPFRVCFLYCVVVCAWLGVLFSDLFGTLRSKPSQEAAPAFVTEAVSDASSTAAALEPSPVFWFPTLIGFRAAQVSAPDVGREVALGLASTAAMVSSQEDFSGAFPVMDLEASSVMASEIALVAATGVLFSSVQVFSDLKEEHQVVHVIVIEAKTCNLELIFLQKNHIKTCTFELLVLVEK